MVHAPNVHLIFVNQIFLLLNLRSRVNQKKNTAPTVLTKIEKVTKTKIKTVIEKGKDSAIGNGTQRVKIIKSTAVATETETEIGLLARVETLLIMIAITLMGALATKTNLEVQTIERSGPNETIVANEAIKTNIALSESEVAIRENDRQIEMIKSVNAIETEIEIEIEKIEKNRQPIGVHLKLLVPLEEKAKILLKLTIIKTGQSGTIIGASGNEIVTVIVTVIATEIDADKGVGRERKKAEKRPITISKQTATEMVKATKTIGRKAGLTVALLSHQDVIITEKMTESQEVEEQKEVKVSILEMANR